MFVLIYEYLRERESKITLLPGLYLSTIQFSLAEAFINKFKISNSWNYVGSVLHNSSVFSHTISAHMLMLITSSIDFNYSDVKCSAP
jgi:hypothetical protein